MNRFLEDLNVPFVDVKKILRKIELFQKKLNFFTRELNNIFLKIEAPKAKTVFRFCCFIISKFVYIEGTDILLYHKESKFMLVNKCGLTMSSAAASSRRLQRLVSGSHRAS